LNELKAGDIVIVMSAGDAVALSESLYSALKEKEALHG
jgi:hypothetical protein